MAASDEWEIKYLTESGWVIGGYRLDSGKQKEDAKPRGGVLFVKRRVILGVLGVPSSLNVDESRHNLINDTNKINALLAKYGEPKFRI
ncbi:MAG: translation initiation factor 1 [Gammaproteobacteria bacterium]|nr:translation initiation factor 1 [Gammaproteobacteria bacterium]